MTSHKVGFTTSLGGGKREGVGLGLKTNSLNLEMEFLTFLSPFCQFEQFWETFCFLGRTIDKRAKFPYS